MLNKGIKPVEIKSAAKGILCSVKAENNKYLFSINPQIPKEKYKIRKISKITRLSSKKDLVKNKLVTLAIVQNRKILKANIIF